MTPPSEQTTPSRIATIWLGIKRILGLGCILVLFSLIGLTCVDVVARYAFNSPVRGAYELTEMLLATLIFLALPLTTQAKEHIEVELLDGMKSRFLKSLSSVIATISVATVFSVISYEVWLHTLKLAERGQVTDSLELPVAMVGFLAAVSCAASAILIVLTETRRL